jgi:hypothetical protein
MGGLLPRVRFYILAVSIIPAIIIVYRKNTTQYDKEDTCGFMGVHLNCISWCSIAFCCYCKRLDWLSARYK